MSKNLFHYIYYVEGENEKTLLNVLKTDLKCIIAGKVEVFNAIQEKITLTRVRMYKPNTNIVFVYDTDTSHVDLLKENILFLRKQKCVKNIFCVPQVQNLEDELERCCKINNIFELTKSKTKSNFKSDFNKCNLTTLLDKYHFDINLLWNKIPTNDFHQFGNDSKMIKRKKV